jgi:LytR cell envelope-related transcriptional attenuator
MAALSPLGRVPKRRPRRPRYPLRFRRAVPALVMILGLCALAGSVWLRVLDRVDAGATAAGCDDDGASPLAATTLEPWQIQVRVYNSTDRDGLARRVSTELRERGFAVLTAANDPLIDLRRVSSAAEIRYGKAGSKQAELVRRQVPGAKLYLDRRRADRVVDLALGAAYKRLATPAELAKGRQGVAAPAAGVAGAAVAARSGPAPVC